MGEEQIVYIENPTAFFIYNKVDCMRETDIINICKDFYNEEEIIEAKRLVFDEYKSTDKIINRKGNNKIISDLQDIIRLIREKPALTSTKFCVTSCLRLPPVSLDHIDTAALLKQVSDLRTELMILKPLSEEFLQLKTSLDYIKQNYISRSELNETSSAITNERTNNNLTPSVKDIIKKLDPKSKSATPINNKTVVTSNRVSSNDSENDPFKLYPDLDAFVIDLEKDHENSSAKNTNYHNISNNQFSSKELDTDSDYETYLIKENGINDSEFNRKSRNFPRNNTEKFQNKTRVVRNRKFSRTTDTSNKYYTDSSPLKLYKLEDRDRPTLRAAFVRPKTRTWDLFVSRVDPQESTHSIVNFIKSIYGQKVKVLVSVIKSKHPSYASFRVRLSNIDNSIDILDASNWPKGIYVNRFLKH